MKTALEALMKTLSRLTIWRYEPKIVGVTGSVGKTSTKVAIATVLGSAHRLRMSSGNLNNELGISLAILGQWSPQELALVSRDTPAGTAKIKKIFFWLKVIFVSAWQVIVKVIDYPEILILEYGADQPGDIKKLLRIARPTIGIVTAVGEIPVHVEFYKTPQDVAREKSRIIDGLPSSGFAVLGFDDPVVLRLKDRTRASVMTFGFSAGADIRLTRFENRMANGIPEGIAFRIEYAGNVVPVHIKGAFGRAHAAAAGAATAVGLIFGMNLVTISEALESYVPEHSRMQLLAGIKNTQIIDDAYNASPLSMRAALETLGDLKALRKVAVLGDMLELGEHAIAAHEAVGRQVKEVADVLLTVGPRAKFIAEAAARAGMKKANMYSFDTSYMASQSVQELIQEGDLVLVKGSHAMQMDKIVEEIKEVEVSGIGYRV